MKYPADTFQALVGKTIIKVEQEPECDEGLTISFEDGTVLNFGFAGCEGSIEFKEN